MDRTLVASNYGLGKIEGREEGREERTLEIARAMKANGVAVSIIAQSTGLAPEIVAGL